MSIITLTDEQKQKLKSDMMRKEIERKIEHLNNQLGVLNNILVDRYEFSLWLSRYKPGRFMSIKR
jgi:hypothetical protein